MNSASARRPWAGNWPSSAVLIPAAGTASAATLSRRTSTQCISTQECQSKLPKNTGVRSRGRYGKSPGPVIRTNRWLGNSLPMSPRASRASPPASARRLSRQVAARSTGLSRPEAEHQLVEDAGGEITVEGAVLVLAVRVLGVLVLGHDRSGQREQRDLDVGVGPQFAGL